MKIYFILALLLCMPYWGLGQSVPGNEENVRKKRVAKQISIIDSANSIGKKLRNETDESRLAEQIIKGVLSGKIAAYSSKDDKFTKQLTTPQIAKYFDEVPTMIVDVIDPVSNKTISKKLAHDLSNDVQYMFWVLEEWSFDKKNGKTNIQIIAIAPIMDMYNEESDGVLRACPTKYWIRYIDVKQLIEKYQQTHPEINIELSIWCEHFSEPE